MHTKTFLRSACSFCLAVLLSCSAMPVAAADFAGVPITYSLTSDGFVSLIVADSKGKVWRTFLSSAPRPAGSYTEVWDGLDRYGNPAPTGDYTWKLVQTQRLKTELVGQVGSTIDPIWDVGTGNHTGIQAMESDSTGIYLIAESEGGYNFSKVDFNNRYIWGSWSSGGLPVGYVDKRIGLMNGKVYTLTQILFDHANAVVVDATTGKGIAKWDLRYSGDREDGKSSDPARYALAVDPANNLLVVSYREHNAIRWYSAEKPEVVDEVKGIAAPLGVAVTADGTVLAISGDKVVSFTRANKTPVARISELTNPFRLSVNRTSGDVFVVENSKAVGGAAQHHAVKRFNSGYQLQKTFGAPGGRADGVYDASNFLDVRAIAADTSGNNRRSRLIGYWPLDESGGYLTKGAIVGSDGHSHGDVKFIPGKFGNAVEFTSGAPCQPTYISIDHYLRHPDSDLTQAFWFKTTSPDSALLTVHRDTSHNNPLAEGIELQGGKIRAYFRGDGGSSVETKESYNDGQWHHVAHVVGGEVGGNRLYVDGKL